MEKTDVLEFSDISLELSLKQGRRRKARLLFMLPEMCRWKDGSFHRRYGWNAWQKNL